MKSFSNDIAFQSLLQSQRSLLSKMNLEKIEMKAKMKEKEEMRIRNFIREHFNHQQTYLDNVHDAITSMPKNNIKNVSNSSSSCENTCKDDTIVQALTIEALDPLPLNISDEQSCITFPKWKRLSLGIGNDQYMLPETDGGEDKNDEPLPINIDPNINDEPLPLIPQEIYSSDDDDYGVFVTDVVEKPQIPHRSFSAPTSRRSSTFVPASRTITAKRRAYSCSISLPTQEQEQLGITKQHMIAFESTMGHSVESQQRIHDWDRKMGLKRSHSKTMRLSMRSRKKIRQVMQKEILRISKGSSL